MERKTIHSFAIAVTLSKITSSVDAAHPSDTRIETHFALEGS